MSLPVDLKQHLERDGFYIFKEVLTPGELARARAGLERGVEITRELMGGTHIPSLDPNDANIRVNNLPGIDDVFIDLLMREDALQAVVETIGEHFIISNFTANLALPGSGSMKLHSDQSLVIPEPWLVPWAVNVIWCLDDVTEENGATRYLPGSHRYTKRSELPDDAEAKTLPFEAPAGSFVLMEGRLWHTSGKNRTHDEQRRMMFAYYATDFIRPQINWTLCLPPEVQARMDERTRHLFGLQPMANTRIGVEMTRLATTT